MPNSRAAASRVSGALTIPPGAHIRIVGDVHGDATGFAAAASGDHFIVQLGDLTDNGPDSAAALRIMFGLIDAGRGLFLLGNHDFKLGRALAGAELRIGPPLARTLEQLDAALRARALTEIARAPGWLRHRRAGGEEVMFVHGGFHTDMLSSDPPLGIDGRAQGVLGRALYGEPTGRTLGSGFPERSLRWVDRIPPGLTVYCGHDTRSTDGRPYIRTNSAGGTAVFMDTGAGKGGHLSWVDIV